MMRVTKRNLPGKRSVASELNAGIIGRHGIE